MNKADLYKKLLDDVNLRNDIFRNASIQLEVVYEEYKKKLEELRKENENYYKRRNIKYGLQDKD